MLWLVSPQVQGDMVGLKLEYQEYLPKAPVFKALASACGIILGNVSEAEPNERRLDNWECVLEVDAGIRFLCHHLSLFLRCHNQPSPLCAHTVMSVPEFTQYWSPYGLSLAL